MTLSLELFARPLITSVQQDLLGLIEIKGQSSAVRSDDPAFTGPIKETYQPPAFPIPFDVTVPTGMPC